MSVKSEKPTKRSTKEERGFVLHFCPDIPAKRRVRFTFASINASSVAKTLHPYEKETVPTPKLERISFVFSIFALTRRKRIRCENYLVQVVLSITKPRFPRNVRALAEAAKTTCSSIEFCQYQNLSSSPSNILVDFER